MNTIKRYLNSFLLWELLKGLALTGRNMFARKITVFYPDERTPQSPRFRGLHAQRRWTDRIFCSGQPFMTQNRATIFSNGIADFRRSYHITKDVGTEISIPVRKDHVADVLASLNIYGHVTLMAPPSFRPANEDEAALSIDAENVDELGIIESTRRAMRVAIESLEISPLHLLIDHIPLPDVGIEQTVITKGDLRVLSIAAASVIAKVTRDNLMIEYESKYPGYGFSRHKGYGTRQHQHALSEMGPSTIHRYSFKPVAARSLLNVHS